MSGSAEFLLGVIALATLVIAIVQVGVIVVAGRAAQRVGRLADQVERELKPILEQAAAISRDAARATALAANQVERADVLFADLARRIEETVTIVQRSVSAPAREGRAIFTAVRAALAAIRDMRESRARRGRAEDEDALFI